MPDVLLKNIKKKAIVITWAGQGPRMSSEHIVKVQRWHLIRLGRSRGLLGEQEILGRERGGRTQEQRTARPKVRE